MNAFVWDEGRTLEFLGDPVAEAPILNRPLSAHQADALGPALARVRALTEIPANASDYLLVRGHVFVTRTLARRFYKAARATSARTCVLAVEPCLFTATTTALADVERRGERTLYGVYYRRDGGPPSAEELAAATIVPLQISEHRLQNDMVERRGLTVDDLDVGLSTEAVLHIRHWSHLPTANYVALFCHWFELTPRKLLHYLGAVVRAGWPSKYRVMRALTVRGRGCDIHPSAVVEASVLGDRVEIGPGSVVRGCFLGDRVKIDAQVSLNNSSLGDGAVISFHTACNLNVLYPRAMLSGPGTQMAVFGRGSTILTSAMCMDLRDPYLQQPVLVEDGGQRVSSGKKVLGPLIGHDAVVAAGIRVGPGVVVPPGALLVSNPDDVFRQFSEAPVPREPLFLVGGKITSKKRRG
jgi:carbonic anhydrase/acetyltransferase-like protein (isoleucine patch superfamily)